MAEFDIGGRWVGDERLPLIIAEIGINHGGDIDIALEMADAAISAGAEVVKHQTHVIEDEMSDAAKDVIPGNSDKSIYEIMNECALNERDERTLMEYVQSRGAIYLSTPFSRAAANRLADFNVSAFKIGSGECNNYPLIKHIARFGKPVIVSTGMNTLESIAPTVEILRAAAVPYALLHCTNVYPTPPELVRLGAIQTLKIRFPDAVVGLSDHTTSNYTCLGAVALGASILERHFTDRADRVGPDIICSMTPEALAELIEGSGVVFKARGTNKAPVSEEAPTIAFAFASVVALKDIEPGELYSEENIWVRRPGTGDFSAADFQRILGSVAQRHVVAGAQLRTADVKLGKL